MKIEIEINEAEFVKAVVKEYAELLYEKYERRIFGLGTDVSKLVKAKALKVLKEDAKFNKTIEDLLKDKEFVKESARKIIERATEDIIKSNDY